jgi:hypothetical protein
MKYLPTLLLLLILFSCKEPSSQVEVQAQVQKPLQTSLDLDQVNHQIKAFYTQKYIDKSVDYMVRELKIFAVKPVTHYYVDSIKSDLYMNGIHKITGNLQVRKNMIDKLKSRIAAYEAKGDFEQANELRKTVDSYKFRSDKQRDEMLYLEQMNEKVSQRMQKGSQDSTRFYQVDFYILDQVDQLVRQDSSSFIVNQNNQIEDLLEDRPWSN